MSSHVQALDQAAPPEGRVVRHPLRERNFLLLFAGSTVSLLGDQVYFVALPWLVLQHTGSALAMGTVMMAAAIPRAVLMLMGGAISDRTSPRRVLMITAWARAALVTVLGLLTWRHRLHTWHLYAMAASFGTADAFDNPAGQAFLPSLVEPEQLVAATSVTGVATQMATIVGPVPAGFVIRAFGIASAFFVDAASFLFIIGALIRLPDPPAKQPAKSPIWRSVLEGLRYLSKDIALRSLITVAVGINFCLAGPLGLGLTYVAQTKFGSPAMLGVMLSSMAVGALSGALLAGLWQVSRRGIMILVVALVLGLMLGFLGLLDSRWAFPVVLLLIGLAAGMANVQIGAWIMQRVDPAVRGRVSSVLALGALGTLPISLALAGMLMARSLNTMFLTASAVLLAITAIAASQRAVRDIH